MPNALDRLPARHPLRHRLGMGRPPASSWSDRPNRQQEDLRLFALSFTAFFICFYTFLI